MSGNVHLRMDKPLGCFLNQAGLLEDAREVSLMYFTDEFRIIYCRRDILRNIDYRI